MENASKAILIAGGVLLAIIIATIAIVLNNTFSKSADSYNGRFNATQLQTLNSDFESFIGREDITAQEIVTLINLALEYDKQKGIKINILVNGILYNNQNTIEFIKDNQENLFTCRDVIYANDGSGIVSEVRFIKN